MRYKTIFKCPKCKSPNIEVTGGLEDEGGGNLRDDFACNDCGYEFEDIELERKYK
jgi:transposase-like protein